MSQIVLEAHEFRTDVPRLIDLRIGLDRLLEDLDRGLESSAPRNRPSRPAVEASRDAGRRLRAGVISSVEFKRTGTDDDELLAALRTIAELAGSTRRWLQAFSPS